MISARLAFLLGLLLLAKTSSSQSEKADCEALTNRILGEAVEVRNLGPRVNSEKQESNPQFVESESYLTFKSSSADDLGKQTVSEFLKGQFTRSVTIEKRLDLLNLNGSENGLENLIYIDPLGTRIVLLQENTLWVTERGEDGFESAVKPPQDSILFDYADRAVLDPTGRVIFFSAKKAGDAGATYDIYRQRYTDGQWTLPEVLGPAINTEFNEVDPKLTVKGDLTFSSDKPGGLGGFDIYYSEKGDTGFGLPLGFCAPVNSSANDRHFTLIQKQRFALLSSDREAGLGGFDIYSIDVYAEIRSECVEQTKGVTVTIRAQVDPNGEPLIYHWDFGDGGKGEGSEASHTYRLPGNYRVVMSAEDVATGLIYPEETVNYIPINFKSGSTVINCPPETTLGSIVELTSIVADDAPVEEYQWSLNNNQTSNTKSFKADFLSPGDQVVKLYTSSTNSDGIKVVSCVQKTINVVDPLKK